MPAAIVLLSGGLDSSTCLAWARRKRNFSCYALSFDYGQRHKVEMEAARQVAESIGVERHLTVPIHLDLFGGSALTDRSIPVPKNQDVETQTVPPTYVPARNTVFLSYALAWAEVLGAQDIVIGVNAIDYSGYPDCRPEFISAFEELAALATKAGVEGAMRLRIHTPLISLTKAGIIELAENCGLDLGLTHSCYDPDEFGYPCGECDSCLLRRKGFEQANRRDPALKRKQHPPQKT